MLTALGIRLAVLCAVLVVRHFLRQKCRHTDTACTDTTVRRSTHKPVSYTHLDVYKRQNIGLR